MLSDVVLSFTLQTVCHSFKSTHRKSVRNVYTVIAIFEAFQYSRDRLSYSRRFNDHACAPSPIDSQRRHLGYGP